MKFDRSILSVPGHVAAALLLVAELTLASETAALKGTVSDAWTGEPLVGAAVMIDGTDFGASTDANGYYLCVSIPETTGTATASCIGHFDATMKFSASEGCTSRLDFRLGTYVMGRSPILPGSESPPDYGSARELPRVDTISCSSETPGAAELKNCNAARLALLAKYRRHDSTWSTLAIGPYGTWIRRRLDVSPGFCFYTEWQAAPPAKPDSAGRLIRRRRSCVNFPPCKYAVDSISAVYLRTTESGGRELVEYHGPGPSRELLFLRLHLAGGVIALF